MDLWCREASGDTQETFLVKKVGLLCSNGYDPTLIGPSSSLTCWEHARIILPPALSPSLGRGSVWSQTLFFLCRDSFHGPGMEKEVTGKYSPHPTP